MNIQEAFDYFKRQYVALKFELTDEHLESYELFFKTKSMHTETLSIKKEELNEYITYEPQFSVFKNIPVECSICSTEYREQVVDYMDIFQKRFLFSRDINFSFGDDKGIHLEVSPASALFCHYFRFNESYLQIAYIRGRNIYLSSEREENFHCELYYRPLTIKVYGQKETNPEVFVKKSNALIETCLFELAYLKNTNLAIEDDWSKKSLHSKQFVFGNKYEGNNLPIPKTSYNSEVIKFYQKGMTITDAAYKFLSFYQVLEYYFVIVSDENLYSKLARRISDPKFSIDEKSLDKIIQDTIEHKRETDETEMLKLVLIKYVDPKDIIEFINEYEEYLQEAIYTKKREIFGIESEIKLEESHIIGNISKRIKAIRNCLVHSSDRYDRKERYLPTARSEVMLKKEIPLLKILVEKVIIGSSIK
jgi:hypothetical protein